MAASLIIESESGTCAGWVHRHNGYYAGDFSALRVTRPVPAGRRSTPTAYTPVRPGAVDRDHGCFSVGTQTATRTADS